MRNNLRGLVPDFLQMEVTEANISLEGIVMKLVFCVSTKFLDIVWNKERKTNFSVNQCYTAHPSQDRRIV